MPGPNDPFGIFDSSISEDIKGGLETGMKLAAFQEEMEINRAKLAAKREELNQKKAAGGIDLLSKFFKAKSPQERKMWNERHTQYADGVGIATQKGLKEEFSVAEKERQETLSSSIFQMLSDPALVAPAAKDMADQDWNLEQIETAVNMASKQQKSGSVSQEFVRKGVRTDSALFASKNQTKMEGILRIGSPETIELIREGNANAIIQHNKGIIAAVETRVTDADYALAGENPNLIEKFQNWVSTSFKGPPTETERKRTYEFTQKILNVEAAILRRQREAAVTRTRVTIPESDPKMVEESFDPEGVRFTRLPEWDTLGPLGKKTKRKNVRTKMTFASAVARAKQQLKSGKIDQAGFDALMQKINAMQQKQPAKPVGAE